MNIRIKIHIYTKTHTEMFSIWLSSTDSPVSLKLSNMLVVGLFWSGWTSCSCDLPSQSKSRCVHSNGIDWESLKGRWWGLRISILVRNAKVIRLNGIWHCPDEQKLANISKLCVLWCILIFKKSFLKLLLLFFFFF